MGVVPKDKKAGELRITIDSRCANKVIFRIVFVIFVMTCEIAYDVNESDQFSRSDINKADKVISHILILALSFRGITTSEVQMLRTTSIKYNTSSATEEFQFAFTQALSG